MSQQHKPLKEQHKEKEKAYISWKQHIHRGATVGSNEQRSH